MVEMICWEGSMSVVYLMSKGKVKLVFEWEGKLTLLAWPLPINVLFIGKKI